MIYKTYINITKKCDQLYILKRYRCTFKPKLHYHSMTGSTAGISVIISFYSGNFIFQNAFSFESL